MIPSYSPKSRQVLNFGKQKGRELIANFDGGLITSDGGIIWIAELDKKLGITEKFSKCFRDYRHLSYVEYSINQLLAQRVYGIILGYEDINDHDKLRHDPAWKIALERLDFINSPEVALAGKSTINRLEYCPETILDQKTSRYHKIDPKFEEIEKVFVDFFLESYKKPPKRIVLDMDVTDDQVHGNQEGAFFNTYYNGVCYAPLYIFCGHHFKGAKLRSSNVDPCRRCIRGITKNYRLN